MKTRRLSINMLIIALFLVIFPLILTSTLATPPKSSSVIWSSPHVISTASTTESWRPTVNVDSENNIHIIWEQRSVVSGPREIYHRMWNDSTRVWTSIYKVSQDSDDSRGPHSSIDELGNLYVVWFDRENSDGQGDADITFRLWNRSTTTWLPIETVSTESNLDGIWPTVAGLSGIAHVTWQDQATMLSDGSDVDVFYKNRSSSGVWSSVELVSSVSSDVSRFPDIAVDSLLGVHITWDDGYNYNSSGTDQDVFYRLKNHTTQLWDTTVVVSQESTLYSERSKITFDSFGNLHVVWMDGTPYNNSGSDTDIFYKKWDKSQNLWLPVEVTTPESPWDDFVPSIDIDNNDTVHLVWFNGTTAGSTNKDVIYKSKSLHGEWLPSESLKAGTGSWRPEIDVDTENIVHIVFQDNDDNYDGIDDDILYIRGSPPSKVLTLVSTPQILEYRLGTTGNVLSWIASDLQVSNPTYNITYNNTIIKNGTWTHLVPITVDVDGHNVGSYEYTLNITDGLGEVLTDTATVIVKKRGLGASERQTVLEIAIGLGFAVGFIAITMTIVLLNRRRN